MKMYLVAALVSIGSAFCVAARPQSAGSDGAPPAKTAAAFERRQRDIDRLEKELADRRQKLDQLRRANKQTAAYDAPPAHPKVAIISWITGAHQGVQLGKKDGFYMADRLVIMRREQGAKSQSLRIIGYCVIAQLYDRDMILFAPNDSGIRPEDEVYIANRENSPYSLVFARLW